MQREDANGMGDTSIRVSDELADELYSRKDRGESYEDVIWRLIERAEGQRKETDDHAVRDMSISDTQIKESQPTGVEFTSDTEDDAPPAEYSEEEVVAALREFLADHPPEKEHAKRAVVETVRYLRQHGTASTSELQDAVYEYVEEEYSTARTMWNAIDRYFADIPGIEKAGYGEWAYGGDDQLVEAAGREHNDDE